MLVSPISTTFETARRPANWARPLPCMAQCLAFAHGFTSRSPSREATGPTAGGRRGAQPRPDSTRGTAAPLWVPGPHGGTLVGWIGTTVPPTVRGATRPSGRPWLPATARCAGGPHAPRPLPDDLPAAGARARAAPSPPVRRP